jgi:hypothetical protein
MPLVTGLSQWRPGFAPRLVHVGLWQTRVALGQVFAQVLWFFPSKSFHGGSSYSHIIWGVKNMPAGGHTSEK